MLLHLLADLLSGFCRLFAWCMTLFNIPCFTRQRMNGGMSKYKKTNFLFSSFQYSLLPATVPFSITESGDISSTKEFDYEKDPHRWECILFPWLISLWYSDKCFLTQRMLPVLFFLFNSYFLNITVTDPDGLNSTKTVNINIININDERPYFTTWVKNFHST